MTTPRDVLTPDALFMLQIIAKTGSFAAAARELNLVPSALTYRVRQIEEALDVLLFNRSKKQAQLTPAGSELLREGSRLLLEIDSIANRVRRVATGWEPQLTIAVDGLISQSTMMELTEDFFRLDSPTRLRIKNEVMSGTLYSLVNGKADLALGVMLDLIAPPEVQFRDLGTLRFVYAVAPHHPLAKMPEPLSDQIISQYRAVAIADSIQEGDGITVGLWAGQDVFTVSSVSAKIEAQLRGLGCGYLPESAVHSHIEAGSLVVKQLERPNRLIRAGYAWRTPKNAPATVTSGRALDWWLNRLSNEQTKLALIDRAN